MSQKIKYRSDLKVVLLDYMGDDFTVARAARVSTGDEYIEEDRLAGLINYLVREDHGSTLEHNVVSFRFEAPLPVLGQFVRHRHISPNVQSGRYSEYLPQFYMPPKRRPLENAGKSSAPILVPGSKSQRKIMKNARKTAAETTMGLYQEQLNAGIANEVARDVLSQHLYTSWWGYGQPSGLAALPEAPQRQARSPAVGDRADRGSDRVAAEQPVPCYDGRLAQALPVTRGKIGL